MYRGVVILGVVEDDHDDATAKPVLAAQSAQEAPVRLGVEAALGLGCHQAAVADAHRPKVTDRFSRGSGGTHRVADLRSSPQPKAASMLLEMDLVQGPKVDLTVCGEMPEFY